MTSLQITSYGWQLIYNGTVIAQSFRDGGCTAALLENEIFLLLPLQESTSAENGFVLEYGDDRYGLTEKARVLPNELLEIERSWVNRSEQTQDVTLLFEVQTQFAPTFTLIPCVSYNGNQWGTGSEPKGLTNDGKPWIFSYKRVGIASATFSENSKVSIGVFVDDKDAVSLNSACSMEKLADGMMHRIFWPEREGPQTYISKNQYGPARENTIRLEPGEIFTTRCYVSPGEVDQERTGWTQTFDRLQNMSAHTFTPDFPPEQVWELAVDYVKEILFQRIGDMRAFHMGLLPDKTTPTTSGWKLREGEQYQIGWCGQNATLAHALLCDYQMKGNQESRDQAEQVLDTWVQKGQLGNGLFVVQLDDLIAGQSEIHVDTCNLAWGAWQTLLAYQKAQEMRLDKPEWRNFGMGLCDFFVSHDDGQGRFGKLWAQSGECVDWDGTIGCFVVLPLLHAYRMTQKAEYLDRATRGFNHYVTHDLNRIECTAGALDTHCIDKETCWPLLVGALDLYELTGEKSFLNTAVLAGHYTLSWMFHYNALYNEESDFSQYGYRTLGATSVSTQHHHLDPWGALLCRDWLRLYQHTGDTRWRDRAQTTWANNLLCLSDGTLKIHDRVRPRGSQNEGFFHCHWAHPGEPVVEGHFNNWLVAWPGAYRLLTLMDIEDWDLLRGDSNP